MASCKPIAEAKARARDRLNGEMERSEPCHAQSEAGLLHVVRAPRPVTANWGGAFRRMIRNSPVNKIDCPTNSKGAASHLGGSNP